MNRSKFMWLAVLSLASAAPNARVFLRASEQLQDFPTAERPVEDRAARLSNTEQQAIQIPANPEQLVFSLAAFYPADANHPEGTEADPWLRVFADGRAECKGALGGKGKASIDKLTKSELTWLLHLAVNESQLLKRSTKEINDAYQNDLRTASRRPVTRYFRYHVAVSSGKNDLVVPELAVIALKTRAKMKLNGVASLNKYATFLDCRAILGDATERQNILKQLNEKVKAELADAPPLTIEDIQSASRVGSGFLMARFEKVTDRQSKKFRRIDVDIQEHEKGTAPLYTVQSVGYEKRHP